jgi:hypothetical protein
MDAEAPGSDSSSQSGLYEQRHCGKPTKDGPCDEEISIETCSVHTEKAEEAERLQMAAEDKELSEEAEGLKKAAEDKELSEEAEGLKKAADDKEISEVAEGLEAAADDKKEISEEAEGLEVAAAEDKKESDKVDEGLVALATTEGEKTTGQVDEVVDELAEVYCNVEKKSGGPCQFNIKERQCPVHKGVTERPPQKAEEPCNHLRRNGLYCKWDVSIRPCPKHPSAADCAVKVAEQEAQEAARLLLPECQEISRQNKKCMIRGCAIHAPPELRCQSMKDGNHTLQCFKHKNNGSDYCTVHVSYPNMSVHMAEMLRTPGLRGSDITEEMFRDKYFPGSTLAFGCLNWREWIQSVRNQVYS